MNPSTTLLDSFPLFRSRSLEDARERIGKVFSPHQLALIDEGADLDVRHNQFCFPNVSLNVLQYGAEVLIEPSTRGDFYMVQLPISGSARLVIGPEEVDVHPGEMSILQPLTPSKMQWSRDCSMILLQAPSALVERYIRTWRGRNKADFALVRSHESLQIAAWSMAILNLTHNLDRYGNQWLQYPVALGAMEEFLLSAFTTMLCEPVSEVKGRSGNLRCLQVAKDYIQDNIDRPLTATEIASHVCVCRRTLELVFKRNGELPPLAYARQVRLDAVHKSLILNRKSGSAITVTEIALAHGFLHMGRFSAYYKQQFGCNPSTTLKNNYRTSG